MLLESCRNMCSVGDKVNASGCDSLSIPHIQLTHIYMFAEIVEKRRFRHMKIANFDLTREET